MAETSIDVEALEDLQSDLVSWDGRQFMARTVCRLRVFDTTGRTVLDRPMMAGQSVPFDGCSQVYLMSARQADGDFQQLKFWAE